MTPLFSKAGLQRLDEIVKPGVLCVFDFDGTLAPIVEQPDQANLPPDVLHRLLALSEQAAVAVLTGRSVADIRERLEFEPDFIVGNHGLEGVPGWENRSDRFEKLCLDWETSIKQELQNQGWVDPGIWVENKRYSLSVHYRHAADQSAAEQILAALFVNLTPPARVIAGKCVFSVLPPDGADKGSALEQLMLICGATSAVYAGDDVTDEDVFRLKRQDLITIRIESAAASAAEFYVPQWSDVGRLLDELIQRLRAAQHVTAGGAATLSPQR